MSESGIVNSLNPTSFGVALISVVYLVEKIRNWRNGKKCPEAEEDHTAITDIQTKVTKTLDLHNVRDAHGTPVWYVNNELYREINLNLKEISVSIKELLTTMKNRPCIGWRDLANLKDLQKKP